MLMHLPPLLPCSGHTTAACFICGVSLFVLLPAALREAEERQAWQQQQGPAVEQQQATLLMRAGAWLVAHQWPLWVGAVATTAAGRVLADAHWCSDVLAGALLGASLTAATAQVCSSLSGSGVRLLLEVLLPPPQQRR